MRLKQRVKYGTVNSGRYTIVGHNGIGLKEEGE